MDGLGVAMGPLALVAGDLGQRRLVLPFRRPALPARAYYMYVPEARWAEPAIQAFCQWLARVGAASAAAQAAFDVTG